MKTLFFTLVFVVASLMLVVYYLRLPKLRVMGSEVDYRESSWCIFRKTLVDEHAFAPEWYELSVIAATGEIISKIEVNSEFQGGRSMPIMVTDQGPEILYNWQKSKIKIRKFDGKITIDVSGYDGDLIKSRIGLTEIVRGGTKK